MCRKSPASFYSFHNDIYERWIFNILVVEKVNCFIYYYFKVSAKHKNQYTFFWELYLSQHAWMSKITAQYNITQYKKSNIYVGSSQHFVHYFIAIPFLRSLILFHILSAVIWDESSAIWFDDKCLPVSQFIAAIITADSLISELTFRSLFIMEKKK